MEGIPIADAHCDFLYYMLQEGWDINHPTSRQAVSIPYMQASNVALQFFAAWIDGDAKKNGITQCLALLDAYWRMLEQYPDRLVPLTTDFQPEPGKTATVLTIEGGEGIEGSLEALRMFYRLGVRAMTLTWNYSNNLASPAMRRANKGLTDLGRRVVREMHRLGIALDVSHLSDAGIDEVLSSAERPIFASHSNARSICQHRRSLQDRHIRELAQCGGVICVNFYPPQLSHTPSDACAQDVARHAAYIASLVGAQHVALGSDFDGMWEYPRDLKTQQDLPKVLHALSEAGFSKQEIKGIAYGNLHDYILQFM